MTRSDGVSGPDLDQLLVGYLSHIPEALRRLPVVAKRLLWALARKVAPGLALDLYGEVVAQVFLDLFELPADAFDPSLAPATWFLKMRVRMAARKVSASYAQPGQRTRSTGHAYDGELELDDVGMLELDAEIVRVQELCDAHTLMRRASPLVADALMRLHVLEEPEREVAAAHGVSRFALRRRVASFALEVKLAA